MTALVFAGTFLALAAAAGFAAASGTHWLLRLPVVAVTPMLAVAVWWQLGQRDGWPVPAQPAEGSAFVAGLVHVPAEGDPGAIYIWTQPPSSTAPRAYRLPYSPQLERQVAQASRAGKAGMRVAVTRRGIKRHGNGGGGSSTASLRFVRLPPAEAPAKGTTD
jgi:hypothetical protein